MAAARVKRAVLAAARAGPVPGDRVPEKPAATLCHGV